MVKNRQSQPALREEKESLKQWEVCSQVFIHPSHIHCKPGTRCLGLTQLPTSRSWRVKDYDLRWFFSVPLSKKSKTSWKNWGRCILNDSISSWDVQQHKIFLYEMVQKVGQAHLHPDHLPESCVKSSLHTAAALPPVAPPVVVGQAVAGWRLQSQRPGKTCPCPSLWSSETLSTSQALAKTLASPRRLARISWLLGWILLTSTRWCEKMQ